MFSKAIVYFGQPSCVSCDGNCKKAWGRNSRPKVVLNDDEDEFEYLADDELGDAPDDPGTFEGRDTKPVSRAELLNKWCIRECERSRMAPLGVLSELPDFSKRLANN